MPKYTRRTFRKKRTFRKRKSVPRRTLRQASTKRIQSTVIRMAEKKVVYAFDRNKAIHNTVGTTGLTYLNVIPAIAQGTGQANRIGNKIQVTSARINGFVNILPYDVNTNPATVPVMVKAWLCGIKALSSSITVVDSDFTGFYNLGNTDGDWTGDMLDMVKSVNTDGFRVYAKKTFKVGYAAQQTPSSAQYPNNDSSFSVPFSFDYTKHLGKLTYDDSYSGNLPDNKSMFLVFQAVYSDGGNGNTVWYPAEYHYQFRVKYVDL